MNNYIHPGAFEIWYGPMKSGKTKEMMDRLDKIDFMKNTDYHVFRPSIDTRCDKLQSRYSGKCYEATYIKHNSPINILNYLKAYQPDSKIIAIDEIQFFQGNIDKVVEQLLREDYYVMATGLNLDFRGEVFGKMGNLIAMADYPHALSGICEYKGCNHPSTRTQRLIDSKPAYYESPIVLVEGSGQETYETRCLEHHIVKHKEIKLDELIGDIDFDLRR